MESARGNRKVLPNYLLDDYVPSPDSKSKSSNGAQVATSQGSSAGPSHQQADNGSAGAGDVGDTSAGPFGFLPRRKKKLRQACVYCRRSHLVCEEKRPCHRCVKRGIADRCVDPPSEAALAADVNWLASGEGGSSRSSSRDALVSPPPPPDSKNRASSSTPNSAETSGTESGPKRKRKAKSEALRMSAASQDPARHVDLQTDHPRAQSAFEPTSAQASHGPAPAYSHTVPTSNPSGQESTLNQALPVHNAPFNSGIPVSMSMQPEHASTARMAPSQLLQGQPIFQPPSSAELDSLFSTYFFDVADAFHTRPNQGQHQQVHSGNPVGTGDPMFHPPPPPPQHTQGPHRPTPQYGVGGVSHAPLQHQHQHHDQHQHAFPPPPGAVIPQQQQQQHRQQPIPSINETSSAGGPSHASNAPNNIAAASFVPVPVPVPTLSSAGQDQISLDGKHGPARQIPGDVYAPYPYRKGYASLMRYMTEQNWSEQSIRSVEAALCKVRRLWFSLEDNIQPSSMIQLQAEWAGNVRYFSESVLPFAPIPMVVCRKAGEVYASNRLAQDLCGRSKDEMTSGMLSCYELMTESSASQFFRLYELAVGGTQAEDGSYVPRMGNAAPLYWNAEIVRPNADGSHTILPTRGIFEMKIAPCGLPSLLVCCFVPLT